MVEGGCLCGRVRYGLDGPPIDAGFCHCATCRRSSGAPVVAWGTWRAGALRWRLGAPRWFDSSARGRRGFCPDCGTQLAFVHADAAALVDVTLASLDDPEAVRPEYHIWVASRLGWMTAADGLPAYPDGGPDSAQMRRTGG
ncbi:MAG TPA: GFA family protein [Geminicoccaceae bacterium]|mgnify:CR=1 FL=1|nr:GFA family protein [Geminicoccus sp.]HMU51617.1 GFA family protein [Geminicoccaceae bacterium]